MVKFLVTELFTKFEMTLPDNIVDLDKSPVLEVCEITLVFKHISHVVESITLLCAMHQCGLQNEKSYYSQILV